AGRRNGKNARWSRGCVGAFVLPRAGRNARLLPLGLGRFVIGRRDAVFVEANELVEVAGTERDEHRLVLLLHHVLDDDRHVFLLQMLGVVSPRGLYDTPSVG